MRIPVFILLFTRGVLGSFSTERVQAGLRPAGELSPLLSGVVYRNS